MFHGEASESDDDDTLDERRMIKAGICQSSIHSIAYCVHHFKSSLQVRASNSHKGPYDFDLLVPVQDLGGQHNVSVDSSCSVYLIVVQDLMF